MAFKLLKILVWLLLVLISLILSEALHKNYDEWLSPEIEHQKKCDLALSHGMEYSVMELGKADPELLRNITKEDLKAFLKFLHSSYRQMTSDTSTPIRKRLLAIANFLKQNSPVQFDLGSGELQSSRMKEIVRI